MKENLPIRSDWFCFAPEKMHIGALEAVTFCLDQLDADKHKSIRDDIAKDCTYEELIHALVLAKEELMLAEQEFTALEEQEDLAT